MNENGLKAEGIQWNLNELYAGPDDPRLETDLAEAKRQAEAFALKYRGKVADGALDGRALASVLEEYEALAELEHRPSFYASLLFAGDTQNPTAQRLVQRAREAATEIGNLLVFFSLELIGLDDRQTATLLAAPEMDRYRHYVEAVRRFKPHTLSEREEQLLNQKELTSSSAFQQLYEELTGSLPPGATIAVMPDGPYVLARCADFSYSGVTG